MLNVCLVESDDKITFSVVTDFFFPLNLKLGTIGMQK